MEAVLDVPPCFGFLHTQPIRPHALTIVHTESQSNKWTYKGVALRGFHVRFHDGVKNIPMANAEKYFFTPE